MSSLYPSCFKRVGEVSECNFCNGRLIKFGHTLSGSQRLRCKSCGKTRVQEYCYKAYNTSVNPNIVALLKEGVGIRSTARLLDISQSTVIKRIKALAAQVQEPVLSIGKEYEVDELCTFVKRKDRLVWIVLALQRDTRRVVRFAIGSRTKSTLRKISDTLLLSRAQRIFTDKLRHYKSLINENIHDTTARGTNHVERMNLNLRTHLKRLCRRGICYTRQVNMLYCVLKLYFWL